ncbi:MAG: hypothetical protein KHX56_03885 [Clostridiales bacterium]|nr:hypothetical protein [Clostridiales bacterium]
MKARWLRAGGTPPPAAGMSAFHVNTVNNFCVTKIETEDLLREKKK